VGGQTILVIEDERNILLLVRSYLEREGFTVLAAEDGLAGLELAKRERPDLIVLDLMLPGVDGLEVCREVRQNSSVPILMLTAKVEEADRLVGLGLGADDYVTKPFSPRELVARVKATLRRVSWERSHRGDEPLVRRNLRIDAAARQVLKNGKPVFLTPREFDLLYTLARDPRRAYTRDSLLEQCWGRPVEEHAVDTHVSNLRRKIEDDPANPDFIQPVRGVGYRFGGGDACAGGGGWPGSSS
jgi:DNA-binding response OmpR family regulator